MGQAAGGIKPSAQGVRSPPLSRRSAPIHLPRRRGRSDATMLLLRARGGVSEAGGGGRYRRCAVELKRAPVTASVVTVVSDLPSGESA